MNIYKVVHSDMMGFTLEEKFFDSKNKAKKELRKMFKKLEPKMEKKEPVNLSKPLLHKRHINFNEKNKKSFEISFEIWEMSNHECNEYDTYVHSLYIKKIEVN